jgi:V/A-type H+/Na+-transporting ATPase subunit I
MAIVPLVRVTLCGPAAEEPAALDTLQSLGCLHLNNLRPNSVARIEAAAVQPAAREALRYLLDSPVRRAARRQRDGIDIHAVVKEALEIRDRSRALTEEREQLRRWIADIEPWGNFDLPEWASQGALRFWFYVVPHHQMPRLSAIQVPWRIVARNHRFAYLVVIAADKPAGMPVAPTSLEPRSLAKLRARLDEVEREREELDYRRIGLTLYADVVRQALDEADDRAAREQAAKRTLERDQLFAVQGWAPRKQASALRQFSVDRQLAMTIEEPGPNDKPPTLLDNPPPLRGGEGLVEFYTVPAYRLWDPSKAVFFAFAIFFAMILSDAGYAAVLAIILAATWQRMGGTASGRSWRYVFLALVVFSGVYGVLVGSYFGVAPPAGSWLASLNVLHANDQSLMMWISIGIGAAHLTLANLVTASWHRHSPRSLGALGWAAIIPGGFLLGLAHSYPELAVLNEVGVGALILGGLLVLLFSSERPLSLAPKQILFRLGDGLKGVVEMSKAFGDVLSYLRLFALGLASIKLAEAFNGLAATSFALKGVGLLLGILVLLVGHSINFAMGLMSGVVHGLRLNLIEFFNWSLPEEGEPFQAFEKKAITAAK